MRGGEVHETGLVLLVFYPVPYADVSSAAVAVSKWRRALVGAAGMLAELFVAAIAFYPGPPSSPTSPAAWPTTSQADVDTVRLSTRRVEAKMPQALGAAWDARLVRSVPAAARQLPSAVLGTKGGGETAFDPRDDKSLATLESVFEFELELPREVPHEWLGSRVHVRFEHAAEPVGQRLLRGVRRAFLSHFKV